MPPAKHSLSNMPAPAPVPCSVALCDYTTPAGCPNWDVIRDMLTIHASSAHNAQLGGANAGGGEHSVRPKPAPISRPEIDLGSSEADWRFFTDEFERYKRTTGVVGQHVLDELWHCQSKPLRTLMQAEDTASLTTEQTLKDKIKSYAVVTLHAAVHLVELRSMKQGQAEPIRKFVARARNVASSCDLAKTCSGCQTTVSFLDETIFGVVLAGLKDSNIQQKILSLAAMKTVQKLEDLVTYVAAEESGYKELANMGQSSTMMAGVKSTYQKERESAVRNNCLNCGGQRHGSGTPEDRAKSCPAFGKTCNKCSKKNHLASVCRSKAKTAALKADEEETLNASLSFFGLKGSDASPITNPTQLASIVGNMKRQEGRTPSTISLPHSIHSVMEGWLRARPSTSPTLKIELMVDKASYTELGLSLPQPSLRNKPSERVSTLAVMDTGAQLNLTSDEIITKLGYKSATLFPVSTNVSSASNLKIRVIGGIILRVKATNQITGQSLTCKQLFYVSNQVSETYLSRDCCTQLQTIPPDFPSVGSCPPTINTARPCSPPGKVAGSTASPSLDPCTNSGVPSSSEKPCNCPTRSLPPSDLPKLPCAATDENLPRLKQYILDRFASSGFNCCEHQALPLMSGSEPLRLYVDPKAKPRAIHTPSQVPLHWKKAVKDGLDRDERLGVIEKVKENTPTNWCSRMVITAKGDGSPRRTVDYQPLNSVSPRQTHHTETPWALASSVPANTRKSVLDAWHGYHSVPIAPQDRHLTTFLTEYGRYQYITAPQGFIAAGDGYSFRMDKIIQDFERTKKCIDDSLIWDDDIESNFHRVCQFIDMCARQGVVFNPKKFQFGEQTVKYLGFMISNSGIHPTTDFIQSVLDFPTPRNITDVRSFFGAVGQISFAFAAAPDMLPFRHLLSSKVPFSWSPDLEIAFQTAKHEIVRQCERGVRSFDPTKPTALATDWSKWASGFWLTQKNCACLQEKTKPGCCLQGWQTVFCGSKFNSPAESRYAPIEGEAMAAAWAMDRCRYFLLGLPSFQLCIDHKPLLATFGHSELGDIHNPRLFRQKEKTLQFRHVPVHIPGKLHVVPDCMSRRSDSPIASLSVPPSSNQVHDISNILPEYQNNLGAPSWVAPPPGGARPAQVSSLLGELLPIGTPHSALDRNTAMGIMTGDCSASLAGLTADMWHVTGIHNSDEVQVITWEKLSEAAHDSPIYKSLHSLISSGAPEDKDLWPDDLKVYYQHRHAIVPVGKVLLLHDRPLIPVSLRQDVLDHLHGAHSGVTSMHARAANSFYWPSMKADLTRQRAECTSCVKHAPSNPSSPPESYSHPLYPFHSICSDFFTVEGVNYLAIVDRYSGWLSLFNLPKDDSRSVIKIFRTYFSTWGIPVNLTTDGASVYVSQEMEDFLLRYGVSHRVSSAYYPRGNKRSEVAVKSAKRLVLDNLGRNGSLDTDRMARALLMHRNQTDPVSGLSPAEVIFGRQLRDHLPFKPEKFQPRAEWRMEADQREKTYMKRHLLKHEQLSSTSKPLGPLEIGDSVALQDKSDPGKSGRFTKTGTVTDSLGFLQYEVKIDGSNRISTRHRSHLRKISPYINEQMQADQELPLPSPPILRSQQQEIVRPGLGTSQTLAMPPSSPVPTVSPNNTKSDQNIAPKPKRILPSHLKEKWILAAPGPVTPAPGQDTTTASATPTTSAPARLSPPTSLDCSALTRQSEVLRQQVVQSRPANIMTTVQAIHITFPVADFEGEGFASA